MPKYVVSSSPGDLPWENSEVIGSDLAPAVTDLKRRTEGDVVVLGAGTLVRGLARHDLVDEYRLLLFPVILGDGKRMFDERARLARFELVDTLRAASGVVIMTYRRNATS